MAAFYSIQRDESYFNQRTIHVAKLSQFNFHICLWSIVDSRGSSKIHIINECVILRSMTRQLHGCGYRIMVGTKLPAVFTCHGAAPRCMHLGIQHTHSRQHFGRSSSAHTECVDEHLDVQTCLSAASVHRHLSLPVSREAQ